MCSKLFSFCFWTWGFTISIGGGGGGGGSTQAIVNPPGVIPTVPDGGYAANPFANSEYFTDGTFNVFIGGAFSNFVCKFFVDIARFVNFLIDDTPMSYNSNFCRFEVVLELSSFIFEDDDGIGDGWAQITGGYYQTSTCGYGYIGDRTRTCGYDGNWSTVKDTSQCQLACMDATVNGFEFGAVVIGQYSSLQCAWPTGSSLFVICESNQEFGDFGTNCYCPEDDDGIGDGWAQITGGYYQKSTCGYGYIGDRTRTCGYDGNWSTFKDTSNCQLACMEATIDGFDFGAVAVGQYSSIQCAWPSGLTLFVYCQSDQEFDCPLDADGTSTGWQVTSGGNTATSPCASGYSGYRTRQCGVDGIWSTYKDTSNCVLQCPAYTYHNQQIGPTNAGETFTEKCPTDYGASQDGTWASTIISYCACAPFTYESLYFPSQWSGQYATSLCSSGSDARASMYCSLDGTFDISTLIPCSCPSGGHSVNGICYVCDTNASWDGSSCICSEDYYGDGTYCFPKPTLCSASSTTLAFISAWCKPSDCVRFMCTMGYYQWAQEAGLIQLDSIDTFYCNNMVNYIATQEQYVDNFAGIGIGGWLIWSLIDCGFAASNPSEYYADPRNMRFFASPFGIQPPLNMWIPGVPSLCNGCLPLTGVLRLIRVIENSALDEFLGTSVGKYFPTEELSESLGDFKIFGAGYNPSSVSDTMSSISDDETLVGDEYVDAADILPDTASIVSSISRSSSAATVAEYALALSAEDAGTVSAEAIADAAASAEALAAQTYATIAELIEAGGTELLELLEFVPLLFL
ncbi:hypothetical protein HDU84_006991 [Entophlyctis sp. JEL0112]|nr:hypothetical protein HDU84_006991 [Entophlyctis sp. JEL0112]